VTESAVLSACLEYLTLTGIFAWRNNTGAVKVDGKRFVRFGLKGSPDILGVMPDGRILCVECKSVRGRLTPEQRAFGEAVKRRGGIYIVARGIDDLRGELNELPVKRK
jgi:hypothetical protein